MTTDRGPAGEDVERGSEIAVVGVDRSGMIVHVSPGVRVLLGWDDEELRGRPLRDLIPERFHVPHTEGFERFAATGHLGLVGRSLALPAMRPDGSEREIELVLSIPSRHDDADVIGVIRPHHTGELETDRELRNALRATLEAEPWVDERLESALGVIGQAGGWSIATLWIVDPWTDRLRVAGIWAEDADDVDDDYRAARLSMRLRPGEGHMGAAWLDGAILWIHDLAGDDDPAFRGRQGSAVFHALRTDDQVVGVLELVDDARTDLTIEREETLWHLADELARFVALRSRREAEDAERQRVRLAMSARGMGVWTHRVTTNEVIWDAQMEQLHGFEPGTFTGSYEDYAGRIHPDDQQQMTERIEEAVRTRSQFDFRCRVRHETRDEVWLEGAGMPIVDSAGELVELTGVCYDITGDVRAREELEERVRHAALAADVGRAFVDDTTLDAKLQATAEAIVVHLRAAFARVWVLPPGSEMLELRASAGMYTHLDGDHSRVRVGDLKIGRIAEEMAPHLTNDVMGDPLVDRDWARREGMVAFAGYPLVVGDRRVGVLALFAQQPVEETTLGALGAIADTVALGIDQSRAAAEVLELYDQTRRHAAAVEAALLERAHVAEVLQQSLLPPSLPEIDGFDLAARYRAGVEEVGGDFYDVFPLGADRWAFMVGDICGRGPEAARFTALARHSLRTALMLGHEPGAALAALNDALLGSHNEGRFCTVVCGVMGDRDGTNAAHVTLGVAGHPPAMIVRSDGSISEVGNTGTLVGVFAGVSFGQVSLRLEPGETLVLYTDGVTESRRGAEMFGLDGLRHLLTELESADAKVVVDTVVDAVAGFDESAAEDDLAVLAIRRR